MVLQDTEQLQCLTIVIQHAQLDLAHPHAGQKKEDEEDEKVVV